MATSLETLELTISGNSEKASQGIGSLIRSLTSLSAAVGKSVGGLMKLNEQLRELKSYGRMKLPNLAGKSGANAAKGGASKQMERGSVLPEFRQYAKNGNFKSWMYGPRPLPTMTNTTGAYGMLSEEQNRKLNPQWYVQPGSDQWKQNILARNEALRQVETATQNATAVTQQNTQAIQQNAQVVQDAGEKGKTFGDKMGEAFHKIGMMAERMIMRMAIKALIKNFTEAWKAAYNFSKKMGGEFAQNVDKVKGSLGSMAMDIIRVFSPLMNIVAPVFSVLASGVKYLAEALQWLIGLLGISNELLGATADKIGKAGSSSKKASKNVLAGWDELNIIQQNGSGGGSGSGGSEFMSSFKEELDSIKVMVGEALLAVGLILAFTGHVGIGIGLAVVGAAAIVGTIATKWGTMPEKMKGEITKIMAIVGGAMLAVGAIIAFTGANLPLGIALMVAGTANLVASVALSWGLSDDIKREVGKIMAIVGGSLLAVGAILTFTGANIPLGIGLMIAGGASLAGAVALNWDSIVEKVNGVMTAISSWFVEKWNEIKGAIKGAWVAVTKWWEDTGIGQGIRDAWQSVSNFFSEIWGDADKGTGIAGFAKKAWDGITKLWEDTGIGDTVRNAWSGFVDFFDNLFGSTEQPGSIADIANDAWLAVSAWWENDIMTPLKGTWDAVSGFFKDLWGDAQAGTGIAGWASNAWNGAKQWWETNVTAKVKQDGVWGGVSGFFMGLWGDGQETGISGAFAGAWSQIEQLWGNVTKPIKDAWGSISTWFYNHVTMPIGNFFITCINGLIDGVNWFIENLNKLHITIPAVTIFGKKLWDDTVIGINGIQLVDKLLPLQPIPENANGAYDIPKGDLFIANEAGAELVGSMNGKTTVANQGQIIAGIQRGVSDANAAQNALLSEQNELLRRILQKSGNIEVSPSAGWGKFNSSSAEMYSMVTGR